MKIMTRPRIIIAFLAIMLLSVGTAKGQEKEFPIKSIQLYVGYPPGGSTGLSAQILAEGMKKYLKQPVIVNFKPGATQAIAADFVIKSAADGYNLLYASESEFISKVITDEAVLKFRLEDFISLGATAFSPYVLAVKTESPWKTLEDLIAFGRESPGELSYSSSGVASLHHLAGELFSQKTGVVLNHIPFQGGGPANTALLGGHVKMSFGSLGRFGAHLKPGAALRPLVILDRKRIADFPDVPTMKEKGFDIEMTVWHRLLAPKRLPEASKAILAQAFKKTAEDPQVTSTLVKTGFDPLYLSPEETEKKVQTEYKLITGILIKIGFFKK